MSPVVSIGSIVLISKVVISIVVVSVKRHAREKHSSLLDPFESYEENEVL